MFSFDITKLLPIPKMALYLKEVDQNLNKALVLDNTVVKDSLTRIIKAPSKRLRSSLLIAVIASQGKNIDKDVITACTAVELVHIGSLIHDDIIDKAKTRWNVPTINSREGANLAIVIGDYILAKASLEGSSINLKVVEKVASTITRMCDGQSRELADQYNMDRKPEAYLKTINAKTASLFSAACEIAGLCCGLNSSKIKLLARYGEEFGISFQLIDDLADLLSTPRLLAKPIGSDIQEGIYTMPILISLAGPYQKIIKTQLSGKNNIQLTKIVDTLLKDDSIAQTMSLILSHNQLAASALNGYRNNILVDKLQSFPANYLSWSVNNLFALKYRQSLNSFIKQANY